MDPIATLVGLSFVVQVLVDLMKSWINQLARLPEGFHKYTAIVVSVAAGEFVAYETGVGVLASVGIEVKHAWADLLITGLMLAGGSNVVNQVIEFLRQLRKSAQKS